MHQILVSDGAKMMVVVPVPVPDYRVYFRRTVPKIPSLFQVRKDKLYFFPIIVEVLLKKWNYLFQKDPLQIGICLYLKEICMANLMVSVIKIFNPLIHRFKQPC